MIWTTKNPDGTYRTIDVAKASLWDLFVDTVLDAQDARRERDAKKKNVRKI